MNYRETIVYNDLKRIGYEILLNKEKGYPDFKVIDLKKKKIFYIEVKSSINGYTSQATYCNNQKEIFEQLIKEGNKVLIAIPNGGILKYEDFNDKSIWRITTYDGNKVIVKINKCLHCKHEWTPRTKNPKSCPNCKNRKWNKRTSDSK